MPDQKHCQPILIEHAVSVEGGVPGEKQHRKRISHLRLASPPPFQEKRRDKVHGVPAFVPFERAASLFQFGGGNRISGPARRGSGIGSLEFHGSPRCASIQCRMSDVISDKHLSFYLPFQFLTRSEPPRARLLPSSPLVGLPPIASCCPAAESALARPTTFPAGSSPRTQRSDATFASATVTQPRAAAERADA